jgi:hypothetical protein
MVEISVLLIGLLILFLIFFLVVAVYFRSAPNPNKPPDPTVFTHSYDDFVFWGPEVPVKGIRGNCNVYEFPAKSSTTLYPCEPFGIPLGIPGQPSLETAVLDAKMPVKGSGCVNIDQIIARKVTRVCKSLIPGSSAKCVSPDGTRYNVGETETIYTTSKCGSNQCTSSLSLIGVGYSVVAVPPACNKIVCLVSGPNNTVTQAQCDISRIDELYDVSRYDLSGKSNPAGLLAQIASRGTNLCVVPNGDTTALVQSVCGDPGWVFLPSLKGKTTTSEQQIAWFGNLNGFQIEDIFGSDSIDKVISKISGYGVKSIQLTPTNIVTLLPFASYATIVPLPEARRRATSQVIDYTLYNTILFTQTPFTF